MTAGETLRVCEVGLRDGLQNQTALVATADKHALLESLVAAGLRYFEVTSFVNAKAVPQMADAPDMIAASRAYDDCAFQALIVNDKGYDRAVAAGCQGIAIVVVITESLCQSNNRMTVAESVATAVRLLARARHDGLRRRVYLAPAWVCPFDGPVAAEQVIRCGDALWEAGVDEFAIADTIGHAHPIEVGTLFETLGARYEMGRLAAHLHDTQALGLANAAAAIQAGVRTIDASIGGLGGCPFAPGAAGNLATEDLILMADKMGFATGIDLAATWAAVTHAQTIVGTPLGGRTKTWWQAHHAQPNSDT